MNTDLTPETDPANDYYANYAEYNKALRTWFLSFSLGTLALFLTSKDLAATLEKSGHFSILVKVLLVGSAIQVVIAMLNKFASWYVYNGHRNPEMASPFWEKISAAFWLDITADIATFALFGWGIWIMVGNLVVS